MKLLNEIKERVSTVDGYKSQFIENGLKNILIIDPIMSRIDYYSIILPTYILSKSEKANVAYTSMSKFTNSTDRKPINITEFELEWADVIIFPFSIDSFVVDEKHIFDWLKESKPTVKIIFVCDVLFSHSQFIKDVIIDFNTESKTKANKELELEIKEYVLTAINEKNVKADKVLVPNLEIFRTVEKQTQSQKIDYTNKKNSQEIIRLGLSPEEIPKDEILPFMKLDEIRVLINVVNQGKAFTNFIENVINKSPDNLVFYSQTKIKGVNFIPKCSITHWYKILYTKSFDYTLFVGDFNKYDYSSQFLEGFILDSIFMKSVPIIISDKKIGNYLSIDSFEVIEMKHILEFLDIDYKSRVQLVEIYHEEIKKHEINENSILEIEKIFID